MAQPAAPTITIQGNVEGSIVVGDHNFVVNTNYGTIINQQAPPAVRRRDAVPQPPRKPRGFIGRAKELAQLEGWIASGEPAFIYGPAGLGKTSLAKQAANGAAARSQPDGVIFVQAVGQAGSAPGFNDVLQLAFDSAYETEPQLKVDLAVARTYLSNLRPLVLLSGFSLSSASLEALADLFPNAPILIETETPPASDAFGSLGLGPLSRQDAIALLQERASLEPGTVAAPLPEIAALLSDTPAALVMIGNAIRERRLTAQDALNRLQAIEPQGGVPTEAGEERATRVVLATLSPDERDMLFQTGAAPGVSVDRKWLEKLHGGKPVITALEGLALLQANSPRIRVNSGFRAGVETGPDFDAERSAARARLADQLQNDLGRKWTDFAYVSEEVGNLLGLLAWSVEHARWEQALALSRGLDPFLTLRGLWDGWGEALAGAHQAATALGDERELAWALHQLGTREIGLGELGPAMAHLSDAHRIRVDLGDEIGAAYSQHNLDLIARMIPPPPRPTGGRPPWIIGGIGLLLLLALSFGIARGLRPNIGVAPRPMATATSQIAAATLSSSPSRTATTAPSSTASPSLTPTKTITPTMSLTPTGTAPPTPAYVPRMSGVMRQHGYCFYGPGRMYLYFYGLPQGVKVEATGRNDDGSWIYVGFPAVEPGKYSSCWFAAESLALAGNPLSLQPVYPQVVGPPTSGNPVGYPRLNGVKAERDGEKVNVTWEPYLIPLGDRESDSSFLYLLETWVCRGGHLVFSPHGTNYPFFTVADEPGCAEPSHGRLWLSEKHGYIGPEEIAWPLPATSALTPTP